MSTRIADTPNKWIEKHDGIYMLRQFLAFLWKESPVSGQDQFKQFWWSKQNPVLLCKY